MKIIKIPSITWYFLILFFLCGYIKYALIIFLIVLIHELGHIFFIKLFKYKVKDVTIYPFGGITHMEKDVNSPMHHDLIIALGGVFAQLFLFFLPLQGLDKIILFKYNLSILIFNLLPIVPLDGSIILNTILNKFFSYYLAYKIYLIISMISIIIYLLFNYWYSLNNYLIVFLFIYKTYRAFKDYPYLYQRFLLERYLNDYHFKYLSTKRGDLKILKKDTYQYFKEDQKIISEKKKLQKVFDVK